ncbi:MAG: hypothetical protein ACYC27_11940 [Armatimonadota bacterium]
MVKGCFKHQYGLIYIFVLSFFIAILGVRSTVFGASDEADIRIFFQTLTGDWVGWCDSNTDGGKPDRQYFHAVVKKVSDDSYQSKFSFYVRDAKTCKPVVVGSMVIATSIGADGVAVNKVSGNGRVMFNDKPKKQKFDFAESISQVADEHIKGAGSGKISVDNIPLGLGKHGKLLDTKSVWRFKNGQFVIDQEIKSKFKALCFSKCYNFNAKYTARRGSDLAELMQ